MAPVAQLADYSDRRNERRSAAAEQVERSQALFERVTARAIEARRRDFISALQHGMIVDELAEIVCLELEDVLAIVDG